jgi:hypothetical protein
MSTKYTWANGMRMTRRLLLGLATALPLLCAAPAHAANPGVHFQTQVPGLFSEGSNLRVALPISNVGDLSATNVVVSSVTLAGVGPVNVLNAALGDIAANAQAVLEVDFVNPSVVPGTRLLMKVTGTYDSAGKNYGFMLNRPVATPPPSDGSGRLSEVRITPSRTVCTVGPCDPLPAPFERQDFSEVDRAGPPVPTGRFNPAIPQLATRNPLPAPPAPGVGGSGGIQFDQTTKNAPNTSQLFSGIPPDMSGASSTNCTPGTSGEAFCRNLVVMTGNTFLAYSTDGGLSFPDTQLVRPRNVYSDTPDGGFCCDQVMQYVPSIDRYVWLIQTNRATIGTDAQRQPILGPNRLRIALASPATLRTTGALAWTYYDITSATLGIGNNWLDYPDLTVGNNFLYFSVDQVGTGLIVGRLPLADLAAGVGTTVQFTRAADGATAYGAHLTQNALDGVYWAGHNDTSNVRVFRMPESGNTYAWQSLRLPNSWNNTAYVSTAPDNLDWLGFRFPTPAVIGAARRGGNFNDIWFAWNAGRDNAFAQPHIELLKLSRNADGSVSTPVQTQIWNATTAYQYPSLASNANGDLAVALGWGGNSTQYGSFAVGIWGDYTVYYLEPSDLTSAYVVSDQATPPNRSNQPRWGDYITVRTAGNPRAPNQFTSFGYSVRRDAGDRDGCKNTTAGRTGCTYEPQFFRFQAVANPG